MDAVAGPMIAPRRGVASVRVEQGRHPDQATHVRLEAFDGPLALLLSLIEQQQLDILEVSLGDLAGAYLDAMAALTDDQLPHLSAFIAVCSELILIKSRALLPRPPVVPLGTADLTLDPEAELRARLLAYKRFRDAGAALAARAAAGFVMVHREAAVASASSATGARAPAGPPLDPRVLAEALSASLRLLPPAPPPDEVMPRMVTLAERAAIIRAALRRTPMVVLQELLHDVRDRVVVAVTFMAMLELVKSRELVVEQSEPWGPIVCRVARR